VIFAEKDEHARLVRLKGEISAETDNREQLDETGERSKGWVNTVW
jgi:hypothetical protein